MDAYAASGELRHRAVGGKLTVGDEALQPNTAFSSANEFVIEKFTEREYVDPSKGKIIVKLLVLMPRDCM